MRKIVGLVVVAALTACRPAVVEERTPESPPVATDEQVMRAESVANALVKELGGRLVAELQQSGPLGAIEVCSEEAQRIAERHSSDGIDVRRVTLKVRNPADTPDAWEAERLVELESLTLDGSLPASLVSVEAAGDKYELRYLKPLTIAPPCLNCHGERDGMDPGVVARLTELYPEDEAFGYALGDLRGAVSVRMAL